MFMAGARSAQGLRADRVLGEAAGRGPHCFTKGYPVLAPLIKVADNCLALNPLVIGRESEELDQS